MSLVARHAYGDAPFTRLQLPERALGGQVLHGVGLGAVRGLQPAEQAPIGGVDED